MEQSDLRYIAYTQILKNHLRPAMGCTEPIAIAYCAAVAKEVLGSMPKAVLVEVSGNIIKNAKSVTVPNTNGKRGIEAACAVGLIAGDKDKELEVIAKVTPLQQAKIEDYLNQNRIKVQVKEKARLFDILMTLEGEGGSRASARIADRHTHLVYVEKDGNPLKEITLFGEEEKEEAGEALLTIEGAYDFADTCAIGDVQAVLDQQIAFNGAIAQEGLKGTWGAGVGRVLMDCCGDKDVRVRAKAAAAAGSDARMSGCELPVIINSGSGNQGITVSVPVMEYAKHLNAPREQLYRALVLSNLVAIRQKSLIGCLSAYCGVISAASAAGAGIAYLNGGNLHLINHTIVNSLAILSGTICDGAKPSCAAKIASAVDAALLGYEMALAGKEFKGGEGIVKKGVENTIISVGRLGREGMRQTDAEILKIMTE